MNYMDDASTFEHSLLQKARQKHIPVTGALELLPDGTAVLTDLTKYDPKTGLTLDVETGIGLFI